jgi:soluble cytochrome b562
MADNQKPMKSAAELLKEIEDAAKKLKDAGSTPEIDEALKKVNAALEKIDAAKERRKARRATREQERTAEFQKAMDDLRARLDPENKGIVSSFIRLDLDRVASKFKDAREFSLKRPKEYQEALELGLLDKLFKPKRRHSTKLPMIWTDDIIRKQAALFDSRSAFAKEWPSGYAAAMRRHMLDELFPKDPARNAAKKRSAE